MSFAFAEWTAQQVRDAMKTWAASDELDDPNDELRLWRDPSEMRVCQFEGINCNYDSDSYTIQSIDLDGLGLKGSIPPWMWRVPKKSINLSNNQWYKTTIFEDTSGGPGTGTSFPEFHSLRCSNCGFYLKAAIGETILPDEWTRYENIVLFDMSHNPNLIGELPMSWGIMWVNILEFRISDSGFCGLSPIAIRGRRDIIGECLELSLPPPWELIPPDPPIYPPYYEEFHQSPASTTEDTSMRFMVSDGSSVAPFDDMEEGYDWQSSAVLLEASLSEFPLALSSEIASTELASVGRGVSLRYRGR